MPVEPNIKITGLSEDLTTLYIQIGDNYVPVALNAQNVSDVLSQDIPIVKEETSDDGTTTLSEVSTVEALDLTSDLLKAAIQTNFIVNDFVNTSYDTWDEDTKSKLDKNALTDYFHIAFVALLRQLEFVSKTEELEEEIKNTGSNGEEKEKLVIRECPHCGRYNVCKEYGDRIVYCGYGGYDYYATCEYCGEEFLVDTTTNKVVITPDPEGANGPHCQHHDHDCQDQECSGHDHYYHDNCYDNHYNDSFSDDGMHHYEDAELDKEKGLQ